MLDIDIKPDRFPNIIELEDVLEVAGEDDEEEVCKIEIDEDEDDVNFDVGDGVLSVAILTGPGFDAQTVDASTVELGDPALGGAVMPIGSITNDVDNDGDEDLLLFFCIPDMVGSGALDTNSTELVLSGETFDGNFVTGSDSVLIVLDDDDLDDDVVEAKEDDEDNDEDGD